MTKDEIETNLLFAENFILIQFSAKTQYSITCLFSNAPQPCGQYFISRSSVLGSQAMSGNLQLNLGMQKVEREGWDSVIYSALVWFTPMTPTSLTTKNHETYTVRWLLIQPSLNLSAQKMQVKDGVLTTMFLTGPHTHTHKQSQFQFHACERTISGCNYMHLSISLTGMPCMNQSQCNTSEIKKKIQLNTG